MESTWIFRYRWLFIIKILVLPTFNALIISPPLQDKYVSLGSRLWWTCSITDAAPGLTASIKWRFSDVELASDSRRTVFSNGTIYIPVVQSDHLGEYSCVATDAQTTIEAKAWLRLAYISQSAVLLPDDQSVPLGSRALLECRVDAQPSATFHWTFDGDDLRSVTRITITQVAPGISTLRITEVAYENAGSYACAVSHVTLASPLISTTATVNVYGPPQLQDEDPQDLILPIGYTATFECPVVSVPASQVSWAFQSRSSTSLPLVSNKLGVTIDSVTGTLVLRSISEASSGLYKCTWRNQYGDASKISNLTVQGFPRSPVFDATPSDMTITETKEAIMNCSGNGNPRPSIEWFRRNGDEEVKISSSTDNNLEQDEIRYVNSTSFPLLIRNVSNTDFGVYTCILFNREGRINASAYLEVTFAPRFIDQPQSTTIREREALQLSCSASGNPMPTISWISPQNVTYTWNTNTDTETLPRNTNIVVLENGQLNINHATRDHGGVFTCIAQNSVGSASVSVTVSISGSPHFLRRPISLGAIEGDKVTLPCEVSASPPAAVVWYYKYLPDLSVQASNIAAILESITTPSGHLSVTNITQVNVQAKPRYSLASDGTSIIITDLHESDAGLYICHAQNVHGSVFALAVLRVISYPQFQIVPENVKVNLGDSVLLNCYAIGIPVPTQRWLFKDRKLKMKQGIEEFNNGSLFIASVEEEDVGKYTCLATNQAGQRLKSAVLSVSNIPEFTEPPTNTTVKITSITTLHCRGKSSLPLTVFWFESSATAELQRLILNGTVTETSLDTQLIMPDSAQQQIELNANGDLSFHCIDKSNVGWYLCQLWNEEGMITSDPIYLDVFDVPGDLELSVDPEVPLEAQTATLTCKATGVPLPSLTWITASKLELNSDNVTTEDISVLPSMVDDNGAIVSTLQMQGINSASHGGTWMCKACNLEGCKMKATNLNIQGKPAIINIYSVDEGDEFALTCSPSGVPVLEVMYFIRDSVFSVLDLPGHRVQNNVMYVQKDTVLQMYSCNARNSHGISATISVTVPPSVTINEATPVEDGLQLVVLANIDTVSLAPIRFDVEWRKSNETSGVGWSNYNLPLNQTVELYMDILRNVVSNDTELKCTDFGSHTSSRRVRSVDDQSSLLNTSSIEVISTGSIFSYKIGLALKGLEANTFYEVRSSLSNALGSGLSSPITTVRTLYAAPGQVKNIRIAVNNLNITVTWNHPDPLNGLPNDILIRVELYNASIDSGNLLGTAEINAAGEPRATFAVPNIGEYLVQIIASNVQNGEFGEAATTSFIVQQKLPSFVPSIVRVLVMTSSALQVHWTTAQQTNETTDLLSPVTGYRLRVAQFDSLSSNLFTVDILNNSQSFYTVDNLIEHQEYSFRVAAINSAGMGAYSRPVIAETLYEAFSEKALDEEVPSIGIRWRLLAIILIVCFSVMIVVISIVLFSLHAKLSKCKSVDFTPPQSSRGRSIEEDWTEIPEDKPYEKITEQEVGRRPSEENVENTETEILNLQNRGGRKRKSVTIEHPKETKLENGAGNFNIDGYANDSFVLY